MTTHELNVEVATNYLAEQSRPKKKQYAFAYHITIRNSSDTPVQLISRHWIIIDGNQKKQEVRGEGVIGQQPTIQPGQQFSYSSGVLLDTPVGTMEGSYWMAANAGEPFDLPISPFLLAVPGTIN